ncbi:uncharacterized protein LOC108162043 isoform X1 [Drosophila miranda]|uniref:uncharacterized protein LOC108162043 isoform X1 n=1 Tax=Drosophila miranda TaxID=7229 RepID=UPI0007E75877|nr:uncharacterized protein LOC108162043 isoform X1 [Drosophila miranda]
MPFNTKSSVHFVFICYFNVKKGNSNLRMLSIGRQNDSVLVAHKKVCQIGKWKDFIGFHAVSAPIKQQPHQQYDFGAQLYRLWRIAFFESVIGSLRIGNGSLFSDNQIKRYFLNLLDRYCIHDRVHRASSWDQEGPDIATAPGILLGCSRTPLCPPSFTRGFTLLVFRFL